VIDARVRGTALCRAVRAEAAITRVVRRTAAALTAPPALIDGRRGEQRHARVAPSRGEGAGVAATAHDQRERAVSCAGAAHVPALAIMAGPARSEWTAAVHAPLPAPQQ
jgi:hypothetical protein